MPMVFVDDLASPELEPGDERHLLKALRLGDGDPVGVSDGMGGWREARIVVSGGSVALAPVGAELREPEPVDRITIGFTPVKGERAEWFVQKLTELGVDTIVPLVADRSVVRWDDAKTSKLADRFRVTAREAAMQSRRVWLPTVEAPQPVATRSATAPLADPAGRKLASTDRALLVGPEGGWSRSETLDADLVALPGAVLRAETAAVAAGVVLAAARDGLLGEHDTSLS